MKVSLVASSRRATATLIVIALLAAMSSLLVATGRVLSTMKREIDQVEKRQLERVGQHIKRSAEAGAPSRFKQPASPPK